MKTIGLIGGMSWESSQEYYRIINKEVKRRLGGLHSAKIILFSVDFEEIEVLQHENRWEELSEIMSDAALRLEGAGADFILICTNTMHKCANSIQERTSIPLIHIADAAGAAIKERTLRRVALLGTRFTMEEEFYKSRLSSKFDLEVIVPNSSDMDIVHKVIYEELCLGEIREDSRKEFSRIIGDLERNGAEGVILGCTEIPLLIKDKDVSIPVFDTTRLHCKYAVDLALDKVPV